ncbi:MAG: hypothetical protein M3546_17045 [Actinomycetota bacterium]|nr:hypothetical protein [Actinomycetota bacterium]
MAQVEVLVRADRQRAAGAKDLLAALDPEGELAAAAAMGRAVELALLPVSHQPPTSLGSILRYRGKFSSTSCISSHRDESSSIGGRNEKVWVKF